MNNVVNSHNTAGLQCPNFSDNRMLVRFIDPSRIGVTFGSRVMGCLCLKGFFDVIEKFIATTIILPAGETQRLELGNVANYGYRRDTWKFDISSYLIDNQMISGMLGVSDITESFSFKTSTIFNTWVQNFRNALNTNKFLRENFEIPASTQEDKTNHTFIIRTKKPGKPLTINLEFIGTPGQLITGTQIYNHVRYPNGRCRFIFILLDYNEFVEPIPDSNKKHIRYAFEDEYINNQLTPENIQWHPISKMFANSSDLDLEESDMNLIETIWMKNDLTRDVTMQVLIAS